MSHCVRAIIIFGDAGLVLMPSTLSGGMNITWSNQPKKNPCLTLMTTMLSFSHTRRFMGKARELATGEN